EFFFSCTHQSADDLRDAYGDVVDEKCHIVYHGVEVDRFQYHEPNADDGERPLRIVVVASFEDCKGHPYLVDACAMLRDRGIETEVVLVGGNLPNGNDVESVIRRRVHDAGLTDAFKFVGKQSSTEVREWIAWSDIGVLACCKAPDGHTD